MIHFGWLLTHLDVEPNRVKVLSLLAEACAGEHGLPTVRVHCARLWASRAHRWNHPSALEANQTCLQALQVAITTPSAMEAQHARFLSEKAFIMSRGVTFDAAALALDQQRVETAIELLEQGRGILLAQMGYFRTSLEDLRAVDADLADEFGRLSSLLETSTATKSQDYSIDQIGR